MVGHNRLLVAQEDGHLERFATARDERLEPYNRALRRYPGRRGSSLKPFRNDERFESTNYWLGCQDYSARTGLTPSGPPSGR